MKFSFARMVIRKEADDMTYVVQTNKLTKTIGEKNLVTNVSMHVKKGEIYGFLGPKETYIDRQSEKPHKYRKI